ncbi:MAG: hypothetical protein EXQ94_12650 [Alphaproteobacteria bacterium]|nr:hypothetical protein [Alphaproteobacteria bacterium]
MTILDLDSAMRQDDLAGVVPGAPQVSEESDAVTALSTGAFSLRERLLAALDRPAPEGAPLRYGDMDIREDGSRFLVRLDDVGTVRGVFTPVAEGEYRVTITLP